MNSIFDPGTTVYALFHVEVPLRARALVFGCPHPRYRSVRLLEPIIYGGKTIRHAGYELTMTVKSLEPLSPLEQLAQVAE